MTDTKQRKPAKLGNMNCFITSQANCGRKKFMYDGTTLGLTESSVANGVKVGQKVSTDPGYNYRLISAPHDSRAGGFWMEQIWKKSA